MTGADLDDAAAVETPGERGPRVAVAHDWLVDHAGSERVVAALRREFPGAPLLTALLDPTALPEEFADARPSWLQHVPGLVGHPGRHRLALPLMPLAWRWRSPITGVDAVVSSSHACANAVRIGPGVPHVSYCHTPMRYAWDFAAERERFPRPVRPAARALMAGLRRWDVATAARVTRFVANSTAVAARIARAYGRGADVVAPPVDTGYFCPGPDAVDPDEFLFVGRLVAYKRPDLAVEAFAGSGHRLTVVGGDGGMLARLRERAGSNVRFLGRVDDAALRALYRRSVAVIAPGVEDFGIATAEAQACGTPVVTVDAGGARDIVRAGETGLLVPPDDASALRRAVQAAGRTPWDRPAIAAATDRFATARFQIRMREVVEQVVADPRPR